MKIKILFAAALVIIAIVFYFSSPLLEAGKIRTTVEWAEERGSTLLRTKVEWVEPARSAPSQARQGLLQ